MCIRDRDQAGPPRDAAPPRERSEFGASVWYTLSVGRAGRAEARWLLPKICDAGSITKDGIGAIRVQEDVTYVQIAENLAGKFGTTLELENGVVMERMAGEPSMDRPERAPRKAPAPRGDRPVRAEQSDKPVYEKREKTPYVAKPSRLIEEAAADGYDPIRGNDEPPAEAPRPRAPTPYTCLLYTSRCV